MGEGELRRTRLPAMTDSDQVTRDDRVGESKSASLWTRDGAPADWWGLLCRQGDVCFPEPPLSEPPLFEPPSPEPLPPASGVCRSAERPGWLSPPFGLCVPSVPPTPGTWSATHAEIDVTWVAEAMSTPGATPPTRRRRTATPTFRGASSASSASSSCWRASMAAYTWRPREERPAGGSEGGPAAADFAADFAAVLARPLAGFARRFGSARSTWASCDPPLRPASVRGRAF